MIINDSPIRAKRFTDVSWELMIKSFTVLNLGTWRLIRYIIHELFTIFQPDYLQILGSVQVVGTWSCVVSWWPPMWIRMVIRRITATPCIGRFVACLGCETTGKNVVKIGHQRNIWWKMKFLEYQWISQEMLWPIPQIIESIQSSINHPQIIQNHSKSHDPLGSIGIIK